MGLEQHPGFLYVIATLLPLVSFVLLLLAGGIRAAARPYRQKNDFAENVFKFFGGEVPTRTGAYVATAAIALACVLCATGFYLHAKDQHAKHEFEEGVASFLKDKDHKKAKQLEAQVEAIDHKWKGSIDWANVGWNTEDLKKPGSLLTLGYRIDTLSATMFLMVTFIATLIHIFSMAYMADELAPVTEDHQVHTEDGHLHRRGRYGRFFMFLSLFCFSMLNLVLADNLFQVFVSWELVGICSYLLVGFYYERRSASNAANKAFITNRVGDAGFIIGLLVIWTFIGTFNIEDIIRRVRAPLHDAHHASLQLGGRVIRVNPVDVTPENKVVEINPETGTDVLLFPADPEAHLHAHDFAPLTEQDGAKVKTRVEVEPAGSLDDFASMPYWLLVVAGLGIFTGCVGKSAQFPLQVWLPDAMEGPTPVSALIHAATMVAAGVYLVGRVFPMFTPEARLVIAYTGGITLFVAATVAIVVTDIKKVLAYSTVSQLGYMMLALGVGGWAAGLFHLLTHAFFKALLFLGSGAVIYGCHHEQDMGRMGGLWKKMPITAFTMLVGVLTIAGIPLFSGWYSKDAIIAHSLGFALVHNEHMLLFVLPLVTAGITAFYMFRMWFLTFTGEPRDHHVYDHAKESPRLMTVPLIILAFFSVCVAWGWPVWDAEKSFMEGHLHHSQHASVVADFGPLGESDVIMSEDIAQAENVLTHKYHFLGGLAALGSGLIGIIFAVVIYRLRRLDPADAQAQFPHVYKFLWHKWYFDEAYSVLLVRPALVVAHWCRAFDTYVIDGVIHFIARLGVWLAKVDGQIDARIVDGLVNLTARVIYGVGAWLRGAQTGYIRSYILFLVLAAVGLYILLAYFATLASAG